MRRNPKVPLTPTPTALRLTVSPPHYLTISLMVLQDSCGWVFVIPANPGSASGADAGIQQLRPRWEAVGLPVIYCGKREAAQNGIDFFILTP